MDTDKDKTPQVETPEGDKFVEEDGQGTLFEKPPRRSIVVSSPVFEKRNLLRSAVSGLAIVGEVFHYLREELELLQEKGSPVLSREARGRLDQLSKIATEVIPPLEKSLQDLGDLHLADLGDPAPEGKGDSSPEGWGDPDLDRLQFVLQDIPVDKLREMNKDIREIAENLSILLGGLENYYRVEVDPRTGERILVEFKGAIQTPPPQRESTNALEELRKIAKSPHPDKIQIPKDLMETQVHSVGDTLQYIKDPGLREGIRKRQEKGELLAGTLEGLSGGGAYLKSFTIALAQTLNEQSKYYKTEEDLSGVPKDLIPDIFGEGVEVQRKDSPSLPVKVRKDGGIDLQREPRQFPYILVSYEELARKMKGEGKSPGGTDISYIRDYISDLSGKQYLLSNGKDPRTGNLIVIGVPFLVKELIIYRGKEGQSLKEVGCLLRLSPQFSKSVRKYTLLRADTIQRIGGGRQKDITMNLLDLLLYVRGTERGEESLWRKDKESLLAQIATSKRYTRQKAEMERDFQEAVQKVKDSLLIQDYREERSPSGLVSVFKFNPNYSKKDREDTAPPDVQDTSTQDSSPQS